MSKQPARKRSARALAMLVSVALVAGLLAATAAAGATPTWQAFGSAEQVYVTGLAPAAQMSLLDPAGKALATQSADSLGGLLFRNVPPATGYHVRRVSNGAQSAAITVHSDAAAPWNPTIYNQSIPDNGYTYLTTRDGTKLAIDVHPPTSPAGEPGLPPGMPIPSGPDFTPPYPTLIEYSGYGYADPGRTGQRHRGAREPDGLRRRRREHARHRLLRRRLRLLRAAAEPRRLRRDRDDRAPTVGARSQGRDDGHLLRRDQPAVHRAAQAAEPRGDLAAVDPRRHRDDAVSRWHPQHRLRGCVGAAAPARSRTRRDRPAGSRGRTSRSKAATRRARPTRCCTAKRPT